MKEIFKVIILTASLAVLLTACGGDTPPLLPDTSIYVDAVNGNDGNTGTSNSPYKTITFALSAAGPNKTIRVLPGTYDVANGEVFPLVLQANQILIGDEANKGGGATPTLIVGSGVPAAPVGVAQSVTITGAEGARVSGFAIQEGTSTISRSAVLADGITMVVSNNTFKTLTYAGIMLANSGTSIIENNVFDTNSYGVYASGCTNAPIVRNNTFLAMALPINMGASNLVISGNTITGNGQVGIQISGSTPLIENNTFNKTTGYTYSALYIWSGTPKLRGNIFQCATAVQIGNTAGGGTATPDLGTAIDPGNNDFSAVTSASITHNTVDTVNAIGNLWQTPAPACGAEIIINFGGVVIWGAGPGEQC